MLIEEHIALLWKRMGMIYGHKWTSSYGDADDGTWLSGLADVTTEQIGVGLNKCRVSGDEWAPTLPIFRERCLSETKRYAAPYHRPFDSLPPPEKHERIAQTQLQKINQAIADQNSVGRNAHGHKNAFRPGESLNDYLFAFRKSRLTLAEFELQRLRENAFIKKDKEADAERAAIQDEGGL